MQKNNNIPVLSNNSKTGAKMQEKKLLKTNQVARLFNVNRSTVKRWAQNGILVPEHTINGYHYYTEQQVSDFCKSGANPLTDSQKWRKSSTIKKQTGAKLQNAIQIINQSGANLLSEISSNINKYNLLYPTVNYSAKSKISWLLFVKKEIHIKELKGVETMPIKKNGDTYGALVFLKIIKPDPINEEFFYNDSIFIQPLNEFDRAVYDAVTSLYVAGNTKFSTEDIGRVIAHNPKAVITDNKCLEIANSMLRLNCHYIAIATDDSIDSSKWYDIKNIPRLKGERKFYPKLKKCYKGRLLDFRIIGSTHLDCSKEINGNELIFDANVPDEWEILLCPILYEYSATKGQVAATPINLLNTSKDKQNKDLPALNRTQKTNILANFLAREIDTMKKTINNKRPYSRFILLKTVYTLDGINDIQQDINSINKKKFRSRQKLDKLLTRFKENGLIRDYIYHKKQQAVYSAEILI